VDIVHLWTYLPSCRNIIPVPVSSNLDVLFSSNKVHNPLKDVIGYPAITRRFCVEFSNTYPFSNPAPGIVELASSEILDEAIDT
jgi:hypothetical protein